jgi:hypothetical protein
MKNLTVDLEHVESTTKIYWTKDYSKFSFIHGNRDLVNVKINKLIKDVQNGLDLFQYCPILVTSNLHIIDGQHRFYVCKKLGHNVYYTIVPDCTLAQIAKVNNNQNRWKMEDFLNCYSDAGVNSTDYKLLREFVTVYPIQISMAIHMLMAGTCSSGGGKMILEAFRNGEFKVTHLDEAHNIMKHALEYEEFSDVWKSRDFIVALQKLMSGDKYSHEEMIAKLRKNNLRIEYQRNSKEYLVHLETLFNFKNSIRKTLY